MSFNGMRTNDALADVKLRGPGAPMLAPSRQVMILLTTVAIKPDTGESAK
jgi:hypothetical protein